MLSILRWSCFLLYLSFCVFKPAKKTVQSPIQRLQLTAHCLLGSSSYFQIFKVTGDTLLYFKSKAHSWESSLTFCVSRCDCIPCRALSASFLAALNVRDKLRWSFSRAVTNWGGTSLLCDSRSCWAASTSLVTWGSKSVSSRAIAWFCSKRETKEV